MPEPVQRDTEISIIIVSYNVRNLLENCLHSVFTALNGISGEVFVVDNNSDDGSASMVREKFPDAELIANDENLGFARANNLALQRSSGKYLLLLNPDTIVQEDTFRAMLDFFQSHPDAGMAGCKIINADGGFERACRRSFPSPWVSFTKLSGLSTIFPNSKLFAKYNLTYLSEDETYKVDAISGSFMFLRREVYDQIGGLDETYFMYGEDLDWCYRVNEAGWGVYYVHNTTIVHYGGESTRRSSIDAKAVFYKAMEVFAEKNLHASPFMLAVIRLGIRFRLGLSRSKQAILSFSPVVLDSIFVLIAIALAEILRFEQIGTLPDRAYPTIYLVSAIGVAFSLAMAGTYTARNYRFVRAALGVILSLLILSSLTFFFKDYAFSRAIVLISSAINIVVLTGYRIGWILLKPGRSASLVTGRKTLLVGLSDQTAEIIERLRRSKAHSYRISGLIATTNTRIGEYVEGVEIIGSTANIAKIIRQGNYSDVIFLPDVLSYQEILGIISQTRGWQISFRIVPKSMDLLIGKAEIDSLVDLPLLEVDYNLLRLPNRAFKRTLDLIVGFIGLLVFYVPARIFYRKTSSLPCSFPAAVMALPRVLRGEWSLVGYPASLKSSGSRVYLGKPGITGLPQLRFNEELTEHEMLALSLQYVRNHSIFMDVEILLRTFAQCLSTQKH